jgi:hypothetical protein
VLVKWLASCFYRFNPGKITHGTQSTESWVVPEEDWILAGPIQNLRIHLVEAQERNLCVILTRILQFLGT